MVSVTLDTLSVELGGRAVVRGVSARLDAGQLVGVIGPNGAGKSTLMRAALGLVQPSAGAARIDGQDVRTLSARTIARRLAYLPQGQTLHWPLTVERLVALGRLPHLGPMSRISEADEAAIEAALRRADILDLRHRVATELSGGERARAMLARALAVGAAGIIADEPLAALDPGHQIDVMEMLRREAREGALTVAILHDLTMAARYCDRLLLLDKGALVADGAPLDVLTEVRLKTVYGITASIDAASSVPTIVPLGRAASSPS